MIALGLLAACGLAWPSFAQNDRAGVVGRITDPSGAAVVGAKVVVKNVETGYTFETTARDDGRYVTPVILRPGRYTVEASKEGFKTAASQPFVLQIGDVPEVNLTLELGAVTQTVTVSGQAPLLETQTSELGTVITGRQITDLPLKDRNFTQLATLVPGVERSYVGFIVDQTAFNQGDPNAGSVPGLGDSRGGTPAARFSRSGGASLSVNGLRPTNNNFSLDGVDNNEPLYGTIGVFPNPDAIQEFKVETNLTKAEVGRGGAVVNVDYKSGTNEFHGSVNYYGQNSALNATHWVINRNREILVSGGLTAAAAESQLPKTATRINEFGFTLGGPIIKNHTFFFVDYLGQRNRIPNAFQTAVPTALSRMGNFSEFTTAVIDPLTCATRGDTTSGGCSTFPGNVITGLQSRPDFSSPGFKLLNLFPLPTINVTNPGSGNRNFFGTRRNEEDIDALDVKIDHRFSNRDDVTGRFSFNDQDRVRANFFPKLPTAGFGAGDEVGNTRQVVVRETHIFKPSMLNEVRFGFTRVKLGILNCGVEGACGVDPNFCADIGIPNCNKGTPATTGGLLTGGFGTGQFEFIGDGGLLINKSKNFYIADDLTIISGRHSWKAGVEIRPRAIDSLDPLTPGNLKGHIQYAAPQPGSQDVQNVQADYLLSRPAIQAFAGSILGGDNPFDLRTTEWAFFVQDDWKVTPNLMLNLGLRYDLFPPFTEADGRAALFDVQTRSIIVAKDGGDSIADAAKGNVGPRVGFAYNFGPNKKLVLRGGYGIFYSQDGFGNAPPVIQNAPLASGVSFSAFSGNQGNFNLTTGPPVAPIVNPPVISPATTLRTEEFDQKNESIQEWNLTVEWQFAQDWLVDLGYVGTRGRHLLATRQIGNNNNGLGLARTPLGPASSTNPNPNSPINDVVTFENRASSNYDAMQAKLEKRFSHGFLYRAAYTWSHNIDDSTGVYNGPGETRGTNGGPENPFDFRGERANSSLGRRQVFSSNLVWDLPFGKGRWLASGASAVLDKFIGGWQGNFIWSAQTGQPFGLSINAPQGGKTRPDVLCPDPRQGAAPDNFFNPACFGPPSQSVINLAGKTIFFGNSGRNQFQGPGFFRTDLSIFKNTTIGERYRVQFGVEFFNAFNQVHHLVPNNDLNGDNGPFSRFDNALPPRTIQYRLKVFF
jgi:hypothetical protein